MSYSNFRTRTNFTTLSSPKPIKYPKPPNCSSLKVGNENYASSDGGLDPDLWCNLNKKNSTPYTNCMCNWEKKLNLYNQNVASVRAKIKLIDANNKKIQDQKRQISHELKLLETIENENEFLKEKKYQINFYQKLISLEKQKKTTFFLKGQLQSNPPDDRIVFQREIKRFQNEIEKIKKIRFYKKNYGKISIADNLDFNALKNANLNKSSKSSSLDWINKAQQKYNLGDYKGSLEALKEARKTATDDEKKSIDKNIAAVEKEMKKQTSKQVDRSAISNTNKIPPTITPTKTTPKKPNVEAQLAIWQQDYDQRIANINQSVANTMNWYSMYASQWQNYQEFERAKSNAENIYSTNPTEILREYNKKMTSLKQIFDNRERNAKAEIDQMLAQLNRQSENELQRSLGMTIATFQKLSIDNQRAKAEAEAKKKLREDKQSSFNKIRDDLIKEYEKERSKFLEAAAVSLEKNKEDYFLSQSSFYECKISAINQKFNYNDTYWLNSNCIAPTQKTFPKSNINPSAAKLFAAASRKKQRYEEVFQENARAFVDLAIKKDNNKAAYFWLKYELTSDTKAQDYLIAKILSLDPKNSSALRAKQDGEAFGKAQAINTVASYDKYLDNYPSGRFKSIAVKGKKKAVLAEKINYHKLIIPDIPRSVYGKFPPQTVHVRQFLTDPFYVSKTVISASEFLVFLNESLREFPYQKIINLYFYKPGKNRKFEHPKQFEYNNDKKRFELLVDEFEPAIVTWEGAYDYCLHYEGRLLRQVEYAALTYYAYGKEVKNGTLKLWDKKMQNLNDMTWTKDDGKVKPQSINISTPDKLGLVDLIGNTSIHVQHIRILGKRHKFSKWYEFNNPIKNIISPMVYENRVPMACGFDIREKMGSWDSILSLVHGRWVHNKTWNKDSLFTSFRIVFDDLEDED